MTCSFFLDHYSSDSVRKSIHQALRIAACELRVSGLVDFTPEPWQPHGRFGCREMVASRCGEICSSSRRSSRFFGSLSRQVAAEV